MKSTNDFEWPTYGPVECPDWEPTKNCGHGLHGLLKGEGNSSLLDWSFDAKWVVAEVEDASFIDLKSKVKFPRAFVLYAGDQQTACNFVKKMYPAAAVHGCTAIAGNEGTAKAGDWGTAIAGRNGTAKAGDSGMATARYRGTAIAGDGGTATAGIIGMAKAGRNGTAIAGIGGTAIAGYRGTAIAGISGRAIAGEGGILIIAYYCKEDDSYKKKVAIIGENGIEPNQKYKLDDNHEFVKVK